MNFIESDIVWHNADTSETQIWTMGGGFQIKARGTVEDENGKPIFVGLPWSIVAANDFDHSGITDIVWHNAYTGETQIWLMNGFQIVGRRTVADENSNPIFVGLPWSIVGAAVFNPKGNIDLLWHNADTGETQIWLMNGFQIAGRRTVEDENSKPIFVGLPWSIVGANDLATDGNTRIVWHNADTGETQLWLTNGFQIASRQTVEDENRNPIFVGLPWSIVGSPGSTFPPGTDILWHNADTGETQLWLMDESQIASRHTVEDENRNPIFVGLPWRIVGTGHFDPNQPGEPI
jgi:hypothetical protein